MKLNGPLDREKQKETINNVNKMVKQIHNKVKKIIIGWQEEGKYIA